MSFLLQRLRLVSAAGLLAATPAGAQTLEIIKTFNGNTAFGDGTETWGNPCFDAAGNMYGCCSSGGVVSGAGTEFGGGTLWKLTPGGAFSVLTSFTLGTGVGGLSPQSGPQFGADGSLYGANRNMNGSNLRGAIYRVTTAGVRTGVVDFPFTNNTAANAHGPIVRGPGGEIYGTTDGGGSFNFGSVWRVDAAGNFSTIVSLTRYDPPTQGVRPKGVTVTSDGSVYFMVDEFNLTTFTDFIRAYKWTAGTLTSFTPFNASTQGNQGKAMTLGSDGNFYVITRQMGSEIFRFFRMTPAGAVTLLQTLPSPWGGHDESLFQAADGHFYTITEDFPYRPARLTTAGGYNVLSLPAGMNLVTGLAPGPGGYVYGVTNDDNTSDAFQGGAVFRFPITVPGPEIALEHPADTDLADGTASIDFGTVNTGSSAVKTFTIKNTGSGALTLTGASVTGGDAGDFTVNTTGMSGSVAAGSSTTFTVTFAPTAAGARITTLQILSDDGDEATFDINLTGTGVAPAPEIALEHPLGTNINSFSLVSFGNVALGSSGAAKTFTIRNTGPGPLNIASLSVDFGNNADFVLSTPALPFSVAASSSATFTATFSPTAIGGRAAYIVIGNSDADENPFYLSVSGTGMEVPDSAPEITSPLTASAFVPNFFSYQITATDAATTFTASGLPAGLSVDAGSGVISGFPAAEGVFNVQISAANAAFGTGPAATLVFTVTNPNLPFLNALELPATTPMSREGIWEVQTAVTHDGVDALTTTPPYGSFSRLVLTVQGPASFSCWWKANTGAEFQGANIRLDGFFGTLMARINQEDSPWRQVQFEIPAGVHTVEIDITRFGGQETDAAILWLDEVSITYPSPDADTDGLPDAWEITHFGSAGATTGTADTDGDGLNNFGEYAFGLNPNSGDISALPQPSQTGGLMTLTVTKQPYVAYTVVASPELSAGSFSAAGLTIVTDDSTTLAVRETAAGTRRFMQIRAVPAP